MWNEVSALAALGSFVISIAAFLVAKYSSKNSLKIAMEALKTARQANDIALGRISEPPVVEIFSKHDEIMEFSDPAGLIEDLKLVISIQNSGKVAIDAIGMELIGIVPLTYLVEDATKEVRPLPSVKIIIDLDAMILSKGLAHIDMRLPILLYLERLVEFLPDTSKIYITSINVVLSPKAKGDDVPSGVPSGITKKDRTLITVKFDPAVMEADIIKALFKERVFKHRVYSP